MTLVSTVTVGSGGASSIQFTNIPQTGKDLLLLLSMRSSYAGVSAVAGIRLNSTSSDYNVREVVGTNSTAYSSSSSGDSQFNRIVVNGNSATANTFSNTSILLSNYTGSIVKSLSAEAAAETNAADAELRIVSGISVVSSAITSLSILTVMNPGSELWQQNSTASLYIIS
jgi:hypothetical protein